MAAAEQPTPTRYGERDVWSVAAFLDGTARYLDRLPAFWIEGEVCELRRQDRWGLVYWTLRDLAGDATVSVSMRRFVYDKLAIPLVDGDRVHVQGRPQLRRDGGRFSFLASRVDPYGLGNLLRDQELLRRRLAAEGLFAAERKRRLPAFPHVVGLVCGHDAAARHDVVENATRRYPPVRFRIVECAVQGPGAPLQLSEALHRLDADPTVEVIVLTRGGGSFEDLAAFSDERLVRAVAACRTPVVSAVGHEQDTPLSDLVADLRASTPTDAAKRIVPDAAALQAETSALADRARRIVGRRLRHERERLDALAAHPLLRRPEAYLERQRDGVERSAERLAPALGRRLEREAAILRALAARPVLARPQTLVASRRAALESLAAGLRALGPGATLERGYAIVLDADGHALTSVSAAVPGDAVEIRLADGSLGARIEEAADG